VVVRRRSSYSSYGIRTTPKKIQIKQRRRGKYVCFFSFNGDGNLQNKKEEGDPKIK
jgi:hypothetical protein